MINQNYKTAEQKKILNTVFKELQATDIDFIVLRNYNELPDYTDHDVDILIRPNDQTRIAELIRSSAINSDWRLMAEVPQTSGLSLYFSCDNSDSIQFIFFDLVTDLPWRWTSTCDIEYIFSSAKKHKGIPVPAAGVDAALRVIKETIRRRTVKPKAVESISTGVESDPDNFRRVFRGFLSNSLIDIMLTHITKQEYQQLPKLATRLRLSLLINAHLKRFPSQLISLIKYIIHIISRLKNAELGIFIVLIGPDGSGKSALTNSLKTGVGSLIFRHTKVHHYNFNRLPRIKNLFRKTTGIALKDEDFTKRHSGSDVKAHGYLRSIFHLCYYSLDYILGWLEIKWRKANNQLIIFDRYYYDHYFERRSMNMPKFLFNLFSTLVPKPDLLIAPHSNAESIYARKNELTRTEIQRQLNAVAVFTNEQRGNFDIASVPTDQGLAEAEISAVRAMTLSITKRRWHGPSFFFDQNNTLRIIHATNSLTHAGGGTAPVVLNIARDQLELDMDVQLYALRDEQEQEITTTPKPQLFERSGPHALGGSTELTQSLLNTNQGGQANILHQHGIWSMLSLSVTKWRKRWHKPVIISPHGMLDPWALQFNAWKKHIFATFIERTNLQNASCIHALNQSEAKSIRAFGLKNPIAIIPNGIRLSEYDKTPSDIDSEKLVSGLNGRKILLFLSRIHPKKGLVNLLNAWATATERNTDWVLVIAGPDQLNHEADLKTLANKLGIQNKVLFTGPYYNAQKLDILATSSAFVLPSLSEGFPVAVLEAMACRLPVLITSACNIPEVAEEKCGLMVDNETLDMTTALETIINMNDSQRTQMGERGRQLVEKRYSSPVISAMFTQLYNWTQGIEPCPKFVETI